MAEPVKHVNGFGKVRWQPQLSNGDRLITSYEWKFWSSTSFAGTPVLYRSEARARRVAARSERWQKKQTWNEVHE